MDSIRKPAKVQTQPATATGPFASTFEGFRAELDEHHDRRERVVKASRDITAASKKIIFALQRVLTLNQPIHQSIAKVATQYQDVVTTNFKAIAGDLQSINAYRYEREISGGIQEFIEATTFKHYLETQTLLTYEDAQRTLNSLIDIDGDPGSGIGINLKLEDYVLGVLDMTGEVMRFAITSIAQTVNFGDGVEGSNMKSGRTSLQDLQTLRMHLNMLEIPDRGGRKSLLKDMGSKLSVLDSSVVKVERAMYSLIVRGSERPAGWVPDFKDSTTTGGFDGVESY